MTAAFYTVFGFRVTSNGRAYETTYMYICSLSEEGRSSRDSYLKGGHTL